MKILFPTMKIGSVIRRPFDVVKRQNSILMAQIQAAEDKAIFDILDATGGDPWCEECKRATSQGAEEGCHHCVVREVMIK